MTTVLKNTAMFANSDKYSMIIRPCCINNGKYPQLASKLRVFFGGPEEIRTLDPYNANVMRSQLRYRPVTVGGWFDYNAAPEVCQAA